jgi:8-oxo-dGTP pyrophosphatase MutT (NUDIX family)
LSEVSTVVEQSFTPEALEARALGRLSMAVPEAVFAPAHVPSRGDHLLNPELAPAPGFSGLRPGAIHRPAAVLIPVIAREGQATVLLTRRASHLRDHSGQVAFPGGKIDAADASPLHAALREAEEEIGLDRRLVRPIGYLDLYLTGTGFRIAPVLAIVDPVHDLVINPDEVEAAFEVPLAFLMAPENHQRQSREWNGGQRHFYAMPYGEHYIWGVTAGIIRNMYERLYAS